MLKSSGSMGGLSIRIGVAFARLGLSPNAWTLLSVIPAFLGFVLLYYGHLTLPLILFALSGFFDVIDGAVARTTTRVTEKGAFLDGIVDRYVEMLLYLGLLFYLIGANAAPFLFSHSVWLLLLVFGAIMPSFVTAYSDHRGLVTEKEDLKRLGGLVERAERMSLIFIGMLLTATLSSTQYLVYAVALTAVLSNITAVQRILRALTLKKSTPGR